MLKKCLITCALSVFCITTLQVLEASSPAQQKEFNCEEQDQHSPLACGKCGNKNHVSEDSLAFCHRPKRNVKEEELQTDSTLAGCGCRKKQKPKHNGPSLNEQVSDSTLAGCGCRKNQKAKKNVPSLNEQESDDSLLACGRGKRGKRHHFPRALACNQSEEQSLNNQDANHQEFMLACGNCK